MLRARLHPRLRPRQTRARPLTVAAHLRPRPAGGEASVQLDLRRARGEERAEDTDRAVVEAGRHGEDEGLDAVVPREADSIGRRDHRLARVGERVEEQRLDRALEPARHGEVVAVDPHLAARQLALGEERVARPRGAPEHAPVAEAIRRGLTAVVAQADERVLAGHQDVVGIDGRGHVAATSTRASLKHAPSEMSAWCAGQSADTVWPLSLVASQAPLSVATTPRGTASLTLSGRWISPRSFHTRTRTPSRRPRARASSGCISSGGIPSATWSPPNVEVMRRSDAGEIRVSEYRDSTGRQLGSRASYFRSRYADASSTRPDGVFGKTFLKRIASSPSTVIASARSVGSRLGRTPARRGSSGSRASSISSASLARKTGSVKPKRAASRRKISVFGRASFLGGITGSARWSQGWPYAGERSACSKWL